MQNKSLDHNGLAQEAGAAGTNALLLIIGQALSASFTPTKKLALVEQRESGDAEQGFHTVMSGGTLGLCTQLTQKFHSGGVKVAATQLLPLPFPDWTLENQRMLR